MAAPVPAADPPRPAPDAAPRTAAPGVAALVHGLLLARWPLVVWMLVLAFFGVADGRDPAVAVASVVGTAAWVTWLAQRGHGWSVPVLAVDLAVAAALVVVGWRYPWLATIYPVIVPLTWGAVRGLRGGLLAGAVLGVVSVVTALVVLPDPRVLTPQLLRDPVYLLLGGGGFGFVATLLQRSEAQVRAAQAAELAASERAARSTERESIGRAIHDSVLQSLAMVHKRGRELAAQPTVAGAEVGELADLAAQQERTLRQLILRAPDDEPRPAAGVAALRDRLEDAVTACDGWVATSVSTVGPVELPAALVDRLGSCVDQALANVLRHARADHVWVFAEEDADAVVVSVRDDGVGFTYDEQALRAAGKYGLLRSIRGRVEEVGGDLEVTTAPGRGTELELRVPLPTGTADGRDTRGAT